MTAIGVIILGNSGVGKSFLGNVILGQEAFKHQVKASAVTTETEYKQYDINGQKYAIYNIPGLIESQQEAIERNKREIDRAFKQHPYAVVLFVFGTGRGGRVEASDIIAFKAINEAYPLSGKSLVFIVNQVPLDRGPNYNEETKTELKQTTEIDVNYYCFFLTIDKTSTNEKQTMRTKLLDTITNALPKTHTKQKEINLQAAELVKLQKQITDLQKQIEDERKKTQERELQIYDEQQRKRRQAVRQGGVFHMLSDLNEAFQTTSIHDDYCTPYSSSGCVSSRSTNGDRFTGEYMSTNGSANGRPIYAGPQGGRYHLTGSGNKSYIPK
jgi:predicted GTPase